MENNTLKSGSQLKNGEYSIVRVLGQGGFGITYEAEQVILGRKVAVKEFFMKDSCQRDEDSSKVTVPTVSNRELVERFKQKFIREAQMIAGFDNDHIVRIHDVFEENGTAYYVMEYLGDGSLSDIVKSKGALSESAALGYIRQIADALKYLHEQNTLHLDIKPANILLNQKVQLKLIDFGISKHYDEAGSQTSSSPVGISKGYAPLEQYQQGGDVSKFTPATDIYALGATLYYLVTGTVPPDASEVNEEGLPTLPSKLSDNLKDAITKAMSPRKKDRPQSVEAFLTLLDENNASEETIMINASKPTPDPVPTPAPKRKFPKWIWGVVSAAVAIILCIIFWPKLKADAPMTAVQQIAEIIEQTQPGEEPTNSEKQLTLVSAQKPTQQATNSASNYYVDAFDSNGIFIKGLRHGIQYNKSDDLANKGVIYKYKCGRLIDIHAYFLQQTMVFVAVDEANDNVSLEYNFGNVGYENGYNMQSEFPIEKEDNQYVIGQCDIDGDGVDELIIAVRSEENIAVNVFKLVHGAWKLKGNLVASSNVSPVTAKIINNNLYVYWLRYDEKYTYDGNTFNSSEFYGRVFTKEDFDKH